MIGKRVKVIKLDILNFEDSMIGKTLNQIGTCVEYTHGYYVVQFDTLFDMPWRFRYNDDELEIVEDNG